MCTQCSKDAVDLQAYQGCCGLAFTYFWPAACCCCCCRQPGGVCGVWLLVPQPVSAPEAASRTLAGCRQMLMGWQLSRLQQEGRSMPNSS
jgi:hypothetical protein